MKKTGRRLNITHELKLDKKKDSNIYQAMTRPAWDDS